MTATSAQPYLPDFIEIFLPSRPPGHLYYCIQTRVYNRTAKWD